MCVLQVLTYSVYEGSAVNKKSGWFIMTDNGRMQKKPDKWQFSGSNRRKRHSILMRWEWTSFSRVSYPWNICGRHFHHRKSRKKQRSKDSCCSLMTLSSFEWVPFSKELFHITACNPFRQYEATWEAHQPGFYGCELVLRNIIPSSGQNYLLTDKFGYGESVHLSLPFWLDVWQEPEAAVQDGAPCSLGTDNTKLNQTLFTMKGCWN